MTNVIKNLEIALAAITLASSDLDITSTPCASCGAKRFHDFPEAVLARKLDGMADKLRGELVRLDGRVAR